MQFLVKVITGAPVWVWFLLVFLCLLGAARLRDSRVSPLRLLLPSVIFLLLACGKLIATHGDPAALAGAFLGALIGAAAVAVVKPERQTELLPDGRILISGEWHSLALILLLFWTNYAYAVMAVIAPAAIATPTARLVLSLLNVFSTGFMLCRSLAHLRKVQRLQRPEVVKG